MCSSIFGVDVSLDVVEEQVGDFDLHHLHVGHVVQEERVVGRGLQREGAAAEEAVGEILVQLDVGDPGQRKVVVHSFEDAGASDNALGSPCRCGCTTAATAR